MSYSKLEFRRMLVTEALKCLNDGEWPILVGSLDITEVEDWESINSTYVRNAINSNREFLAAGKRVRVETDVVDVDGSYRFRITLMQPDEHRGSKLKAAERGEIAMIVQKLLMIDIDATRDAEYQQGQKDMKQAIINALTGQNEVAE